VSPESSDEVDIWKIETDGSNSGEPTEFSDALSRSEVPTSELLKVMVREKEVLIGSGETAELYAAFSDVSEISLGL